MSVFITKSKMKKTSSVIGLFNDKIVEIVSDSTAHGIKNVFKSQNWIVKIFWTLFFIVGSAAAVFCEYIIHT